VDDDKVLINEVTVGLIDNNNNNNNNVSEVIWQTAASPTCHPMRLRMDSSDLDCHLIV